MAKSEKRFQLAKPGQEHLWDPIEECPFPLSELDPPYPLSDEDSAAALAQFQEEQLGKGA